MKSLPSRIKHLAKPPMNGCFEVFFALTNDDPDNTTTPFDGYFALHFNGHLVGPNEATLRMVAEDGKKGVEIMVKQTIPLDNIRSLSGEEYDLVMEHRAALVDSSKAKKKGR